MRRPASTARVCRFSPSSSLPRVRERYVWRGEGSLGKTVTQLRKQARSQDRATQITPHSSHGERITPVRCGRCPESFFLQTLKVRPRARTATPTCRSSLEVLHGSSTRRRTELTGRFPHRATRTPCSAAATPTRSRLMATTTACTAIRKTTPSGCQSASRATPSTAGRTFRATLAATASSARAATARSHLPVAPEHKARRARSSPFLILPIY